LDLDLDGGVDDLLKSDAGEETKNCAASASSDDDIFAPPEPVQVKPHTKSFAPTYTAANEVAKPQV
jgi:hypothetical protein